jgi:hypothetical protein
MKYELTFSSGSCLTNEVDFIYIKFTRKIDP